MRRAYKFRLRPTKGQHLRLQACLDDHRELYNAALQERREAYEAVVRRSARYFGPSRPKTPVRYGTQSAQLSEIRVLPVELFGDSSAGLVGDGSATLVAVDLGLVGL